MQFITVPDHKEGTQALAEKILSFLNKGNKVLWLVPGGSNIPITAEAMNIIRSTVLADSLGNLTITLTDERYGPVGDRRGNIADGRIRKQALYSNFSDVSRLETNQRCLYVCVQCDEKDCY